MAKNYEFVSKAKLKPVKKTIDTIIKELQKNMKEYHSITFKPILVGSAKRSLVTQEVNGNKGFDFDYNFSIQKDSNLNEKELKLLFIEELNEILVNTPYQDIKNNKQSMTIKFINNSQSKIVHSCDFAIVNDYEDEYDNFQEILIWDNNDYFWNKRPYAKNYQDKVSNLLANGLWMEVKDEYLKLKNNNNDLEKKSFSLYFEAVNNVYNRYDWY